MILELGLLLPSGGILALGDFFQETIILEKSRLFEAMCRGSSSVYPA